MALQRTRRPSLSLGSLASLARLAAERLSVRRLMRIPSDLVKAIWRRFERERRPTPEMTFPDGVADAIDLQAGPGRGHVLRVDGTIFEWDTEFEGLRPADEHSSLRALAMSAKLLPALKAALPARGSSSVECGACGGHGFLDLDRYPKYLVCENCDGLGWTAA